MRPVRRLMDKLEKDPSEEHDGGAFLCCLLLFSSYLSLIGLGFPVSEFAIEPATMADVKDAYACTKPSAHRFLERYAKWNEEFGAHL